MVVLYKFTLFSQLVSTESKKIINSFVWEFYHICPFVSTDLRINYAFDLNHGRVWDRFGTAVSLLWPSAKKFKSQDLAIVNGVEEDISLKQQWESKSNNPWFEKAYSNRDELFQEFF